LNEAWFLQRFYHIITMGCQMNEYDSDRLGQMLERAQYLPAEDPGNADLILINTCAVRAKAEHKALSVLGRTISLKRSRPEIFLGMTGCVAQHKGALLLERYPELDFVLGTRELGRFPEILEKLDGRPCRVNATELRTGSVPLVCCKGFFKGRVKSYITIMEGCNNFCAYCVVPYVRGREVSRSPQDIKTEAEYLIQEGVKEVTLLGQNVNSYFYKDGYLFTFSDLLRMLHEMKGLERIRFTTSHPKDLSDELVQCFADLGKVCSHIHLPFQAGSNRVLKAMNRGYDRDKYMDLIRKLREVRAGMAVTSDVMVGFPGETPQDFELTLDLIRRVEFDSLYSFKYSDREGTRAAAMDGKIDEGEKLERLSVLQNLQKTITLKNNKGMVGKIVKILVEGESKKGGQLTGRTSTNKIVNFSGDPMDIGNIVKVVIKRAHTNSLWGEQTESAMPAATGH
jgi:tRNA-2-methylthio-N6-dimethylallyladenosine synthase